MFSTHQYTYLKFFSCPLGSATMPLLFCILFMFKIFNYGLIWVHTFSSFIISVPLIFQFGKKLFHNLFMHICIYVYIQCLPLLSMSHASSVYVFSFNISSKIIFSEGLVWQTFWDILYPSTFLLLWYIKWKKKTNKCLWNCRLKFIKHNRSRSPQILLHCPIVFTNVHKTSVINLILSFVEIDFPIWEICELSLGWFC